MIKCPFCREKYTIDFDIKDLSKLISSNSSHIEILRKARNKINDSINLDIKNIKTDMKEIISLIDELTENIDKDKKVFESLFAMFNYKTTDIQDLSNEERYNIKGKKNWEAFIANKLIDKMYDTNGKSLVYNNILQKAALVGNGGVYWGYTANFNIQPIEFYDLLTLFKSKEITENKINLEGNEYKIINYKSESLMDLKQIDGEMGATIGKISKGFIFGIYNSNLNYRLNGEPNKQNLELCHKIVEEFTEEMIDWGY